MGLRQGLHLLHLGGPVPHQVDLLSGNVLIGSEENIIRSARQQTHPGCRLRVQGFAEDREGLLHRQL